MTNETVGWNMKENVLKYNLTDFIDICEQSNIDFAKITYECMAIKFIDKRLQNGAATYTFIEPFLDRYFTKIMKYEVLATLHKSYLMYQVEGKAVTVWVCYTENEHSGQGHMTNLLKILIKNHQNKTITVDTHNQSLRSICSTLGINLFR